MIHTMNKETYGHRVNEDMDGLVRDCGNSSALLMV